MNDLEILSLNLKRHRQFKGLSQKELAQKVGLTSDTISRIESGRQENIGMKYLVSICKTLDISMEELFMSNPKSIPLKIIVSDKNVKTIESLLDIMKK